MCDFQLSKLRLKQWQEYHWHMNHLLRREKNFETTLQFKFFSDSDERPPPRVNDSYANDILAIASNSILKAGNHTFCS